MIGLIVFIICIAISVVFYKKVSNGCRIKLHSNVRTLLTALLSSTLLFFITFSIGISAFSSSEKVNISTKNNTSTIKNSSEIKNVYICNKFDAVTQTRQGTKYDSGYYADKNILIEYTISDSKLISRMPIPNEKDSIFTATFNNIAKDGSRKYSRTSNNYFVYNLNDNTIKVITVSFNFNMTLTQICSK